jgi:MFS family permease
MQVLYRPHERFRVMSIFGLLGGAAGILGPVLGGIIIEQSVRPQLAADLFDQRAGDRCRHRSRLAGAAGGAQPGGQRYRSAGNLLAVVGGGALLLADRRPRPALAAMDGAAAAAVAHHGVTPLASSAGP